MIASWITCEVTCDSGGEGGGSVWGAGSAYSLTCGLEELEYGGGVDAGTFETGVMGEV